MAEEPKADKQTSTEDKTSTEDQLAEKHQVQDDGGVHSIVLPVILADTPEQKIQALGLGRGVNGTEQRPWVSKSSYQVREIVLEGPECNIVTTDEGGALHSYKREVNSSREQSVKLGLEGSVPEYQSVSVSIADEYSRSSSTSHVSIGKQTLTRTISFKPTPNSSDENIAKDILEFSGKYDATNEKPLVSQAEQLDLSDFYSFIRSYAVTHYVSSITLGANMYSIHTGSSTTSKNNLSQTTSASKASFSFGFLSSRNQSSNTEDSNLIGKIAEDGSVEKEAVIHIELSPITSLFRRGLLKTKIETALEKFIKEQWTMRDATYIITCRDNDLYLTVQEEKEKQFVLSATDDKTRASSFHIKMHDDHENPFQFFIGWNGRRDMDNNALRYLDVPVCVKGTNNGPLLFQNRAKQHNCLFAINERFLQEFQSFRSDTNVNTDLWVRGLESYLIRCTGRERAVDGYLAVVRADPGYKVIARASAAGHNDYLTFRLQPQNVLFPVKRGEDTSTSVINIFSE